MREVTSKVPLKTNKEINSPLAYTGGEQCN
jgi:hypothetical protein